MKSLKHTLTESLNESLKSFNFDDTIFQRTITRIQNLDLFQREVLYRDKTNFIQGSFFTKSYPNGYWSNLSDKYNTLLGSLSLLADAGLGTSKAFKDLFDSIDDNFYADIIGMERTVMLMETKQIMSLSNAIIEGIHTAISLWTSNNSSTWNLAFGSKGQIQWFIKIKENISEAKQDIENLLTTKKYKTKWDVTISGATLVITINN